MKGLLLFLCIASHVLAEEAAPPGELVVFLLDTSGSMEGREDAMVQGVNDVLSNMTKTLQSTGWKGAFDVEIYTFSHDTRKLLFRRPLREDPRLERNQYHCFGGTPLYDVLGETLDTIPSGTTLVVATDGQDTTSHRYMVERVRQLMAEARERDVEFIYIYENTEAFTGGVHAGFFADASGSLPVGTHAISTPVGSSMGVAIGSSASAFASVSVGVGGSVFRHVAGTAPVPVGPGATDTNDEL